MSDSFLDSPREARLRAEAAHRYPEVTPGRWMLASVAAAAALDAARLRGSLASRARILRGDDWEFRGGAPEIVMHPSRVRTRWSDRPDPVHRDRALAGTSGAF